MFVIKDKLPFTDTTKRICKVCGQEKILNSEFNFHSAIGYYSNCCKECANRRRTLRRKGYPDPPEYSVLKKVATRKKRLTVDKPYRRTTIANRKRLDTYHSDKRKGLENDLTIDFIEKLLLLPCSYCGYPSTGLDRLDNSQGHTKENCVPCCKECNVARMNNFTYEEMKILGKVIRSIKDNRNVS